MKPLTVLACILIAIVFGLAGAAVFGPTLLPATFCAQIDPNCMREWISAFSGWAAAALALAAALLALPALRSQVAEAQKQSAFLLGDADVTLDLYPSRDMVDGGLVELRLTNWNRRSLEVKEIEISIAERGDFHAGILSMTHADNDLRAGEVMHADAHRLIKFTSPIVIAGWENRAQPPVALVIDINVEFANQIVLPATRKITVSVGYDQLGARHTQTLEATRRFEIRQRRGDQQ